MRFSASAVRRIRPELLDRLPATDPRARQSRRDLQKINFFMGHARLISHALDRASNDGDLKSIVELGAGDGTLLLRTASRLGRRHTPVRVTALDREPSISRETAAGLRDLNWHVAEVKSDVFTWLDRQDSGACDFMFANLFLHHFTNEDLGTMFGEVSRRTRWFAACEPLRSRSAMTGVALLPVIGCNDVTLHDGRVSVDAGFAGTELTDLWPGSATWRCTEKRAGVFSHYFEAHRAETR